MTNTLPRAGFASAADPELVALVLAGRSEAYEPLVNRHQRLLYRHARGMGLDHDTSLDLVQDAFVRAYSLLAECREPGHFRAWVFRIARNLCLDHLKSVRRLTVPLSHVADAEDIPHMGGEDGDAERTVREALLRLPVALREAFLLKHDAGYTYEEVAELTSASPSAVKMRVHRAREALRAFLIEQGITAA
jgi:RNA polymerase sigma-70 factor (ECF subfamily)